MGPLTRCGPTCGVHSFHTATVDDLSVSRADARCLNDGPAWGRFSDPALSLALDVLLAAPMPMTVGDDSVAAGPNFFTGPNSAQSPSSLLFAVL
jgi:hypothetical protein